MIKYQWVNNADFDPNRQVQSHKPGPKPTPQHPTDGKDNELGRQSSHPRQLSKTSSQFNVREVLARAAENFRQSRRDRNSSDDLKVLCSFICVWSAMLACFALICEFACVFAVSYFIPVFILLFCFTLFLFLLLVLFYFYFYFEFN